MEKKYNLIKEFRLETYVKVNGEMIPISFSGGSTWNGKKRNGSFTTSDPEIQKAIEKDKAYGSQWIIDPNCQYKIDNQKPTEKPIPVIPPVNDPPTPAGGNNEPEKPVIDPATTAPTTGPVVDQDLLEATNFTLAKLYIKQKFPETKTTDITPAAKLREYAKSKGVTFINWPEA